MEEKDEEIQRLEERLARVEQRLAHLESPQEGPGRPPGRGGDPRLQRFRLLENLPLVLLILLLAWLAVERLLYHLSG